MITIQNAYTGQTLAQVRTLTDARRHCEQNLLRSSASREGFLSTLAAGLIQVYDASATIYQGGGF